MTEIPFSERTLGPDDFSRMGAQKVSELSDSDLDVIMQVTVLLPSGSDPARDSMNRMSRAELREAHRPSQLDVDKVISFAGQHHLTVVDWDRPPRMVVLRGKVRDVTTAFGAKVELWEERWPWPQQVNPQPIQPTRSFRWRPKENLKVPAALGGRVQGAFGIDDRKEVRMQMHVASGGRMQMHNRPRDEVIAADLGASEPEFADPGASEPEFIVRELADIYEFPDELQGRGQTIAILSLGGRLDRDELARYCKSLGVDVPQVIERPVDCELPQLGAFLDEDAEVALDVQIIVAFAPSARIVIYYAENTSQGFLNGLARAIYNDSLPASIISISWGAYEDSWTRQAIFAIDDLLADAKALGITVCCASGDLRSSDGAPDDSSNVDFPASSPHVLACGGTTLRPGPGGQARPVEVVWDEPGSRPPIGSGGGFSTVFPQPDWQQGLPVPEPEKPMRGVPDVSGVADPRNGFPVSVSGQNVLVGGTSAVAPFWAGLIARINEKLGQPVGYINPLLYQIPHAFHDIMDGNNGAWSATKGWDACTGLGSPAGTALLQELMRQFGSDDGP